MLSQADIGAFLADGYIAVRGAVPTPVAAACREVIWAELSQRGVRPDDPATWTAPVVRISCPEGGPFVAARAVRLLREACDQLIGAGRWWQRWVRASRRMPGNTSTPPARSALLARAALPSCASCVPPP